MSTKKKPTPSAEKNPEARKAEVIQALKKRYEKHPEALDEEIISAKENEAVIINEQGVRAQVDYLATKRGLPELEELLKRETGDR